MECQAALETAVCNAIIAGAIGYDAKTCRRMWDGEPPPLMGQAFVSVWYDGQRTNQAFKTSLDELFGVYVTITLRFVKPFDQLVFHRDDMELRANAIRALVQKDAWDHRISRAANELAGFDGNNQPVGFRESLAFERFEPIQMVGPAWFKGAPAANDVGAAQLLRFGKSRRVQAITTAS